MSGRFAIALASLALLGAALLRVWVHQSVIEFGYEISEERGRARHLAKERKALEVELSTLRSPERLRQEAKGLGLAPMTPRQLYVVKVEVQP
ncbi:MAG: hypothetical protein AAFQ82_12500 [Myxococcota bacterium]